MLSFRFAITDAIDAATGVIQGVSVLTAGEARGHSIYMEGKEVPMLIDMPMLDQVASRIQEFGASGVKVKADHWSGFDRIVGVLRDPKIEGTQVRADLHLLRTHPMFATIIELAQRQPGTFGLSISFSGTPVLLEGKAYARCTELYSVDLVDEPAANPTGLFSKPSDSENKKWNDMTLDDIRQWFRKEVETSTPTELAAAQSKITELEAKQKATETELSGMRAKLDEAIAAKDKEIADLAAKHKEALAALDADVEKRASAKALQITAAQGQPPLPTVPPIVAGKNPTGELKGLDRTIAAFKEAASKNS